MQAQLLDQLPPLIESLGYPGNFRYLTVSLGFSDAEAQQILQLRGISPNLADPVIRSGSNPDTAEKYSKIVEHYWDTYTEGTPHYLHFAAVSDRLHISKKVIRQALKRAGRQPSQVRQQQREECRQWVIEFARDHKNWSYQAIAQKLDISTKTVSEWIREYRKAAQKEVRTCV
ncbi:MAG: hypothetical protein HC771_23830 [Synechococcales cyanobacterium CRU_2_2]|nr:hypothetical protein [Synechococcales cyanobacterium CRU_2_2]